MSDIRRIGAHLSTVGGVDKAVERAHAGLSHAVLAVAGAAGRHHRLEAMDPGGVAGDAADLLPRRKGGLGDPHRGEHRQGRDGHRGHRLHRRRHERQPRREDRREGPRDQRRLGPAGLPQQRPHERHPGEAVRLLRTISGYAPGFARAAQIIISDEVENA